MVPDTCQVSDTGLPNGAPWVSLVVPKCLRKDQLGLMACLRRRLLEKVAEGPFFVDICRRGSLVQAIWVG